MTQTSERDTARKPWLTEDVVITALIALIWTVTLAALVTIYALS